MSKSSELDANSWIVVDRVTGLAVCELYNQATVDKVNFDKYRAFNPLSYLESLNNRRTHNG